MIGTVLLDLVIALLVGIALHLFAPTRPYAAPVAIVVFIVLLLANVVSPSV